MTEFQVYYYKESNNFTYITLNYCIDLIKYFEKLYGKLKRRNASIISVVFKDNYTNKIIYNMGEIYMDYSQKQFADVLAKNAIKRGFTLIIEIRIVDYIDTN